MTKFEELVADQFLYGGKKYANSNQKEVTDILTEDYGLNGLLWCINKYVYRYENLNRVKDLLKISCYMYILWLKFGYHISEYGTAELQNTTVDIKEKYFTHFLNIVNISVNKVKKTKKENLEKITHLLKSLKIFPKEKTLIRIFTLCFAIWIYDNWDNKKDIDTDTWNEAKK